MVGYDVDLSDPDGGASVVLDIAARHMNRNGSLHGGIIAMMLDAAAGFAASRAAGEPDLVPVVTVSLNTQFVAPVQSGRVITTGLFTGGGRSIVYAGAELRTEAGVLLATATGVFKVMRKRGAA